MGAGEPPAPRFIAGVASWGWGRAPPGGEEERRQSNKHSRHPGLLLAQTPRSPSVTITGITKAPIHKEPGPSQLLARAAITLQTGNTALDYLGTSE